MASVPEGTPRKPNFKGLHEFLENIYGSSTFKSDSQNLGESDHPKRRGLSKDVRLYVQKVKTAFDKAAKSVFGKKGLSVDDLDDPVVKQLMNENYRAFLSAVQPSLTEKVPEVMQRALKENVFVFSGMKTYTVLKEVGSLDFTDKAGKPKSWHEFKKDADKLNVKYNEHYLRTEHQFAASSAQHAANWAAYEADGDRYNLQYRTAGDDRVRDDHEAMDGITLPLDDPFWDESYPPNGWNCRCTVVQVRKGKYEVSDSKKAIEAGRRASTKIGKDGRNAAAVFRFNPGKEQKIFPKGHPYTSGDCNKLAAVWRFLSEGERRKMQKICDAQKAINKRAKSVEEKRAVYALPREEQFETIKDKKTGLSIRKHKLPAPNPNDPNDDFKDRVRVAFAAKEKSWDWEVLPEIHVSEIEARKKIFPGYKPESANSDFRSNDGFYLDLKRPTSIDNIIQNANDAVLRQDAIAIISDSRMPRKITAKQMKQNAIAVFNDKHYSKDVIYFESGGELHKYNRADLKNLP